MHIGLANKQAHLLKFDLSYRSDLWSTTASPLPDDIQQIYKQLLQEIESLRNLSGWRLAAIVAGREEGVYRQLWDDLLSEVEFVYNLAAQAQLWLIKYNPVLPPECLPGRVETVLDEIIEHLTQGSKLGSLKLLRHRDWKILIDSSFIENKHPETLEHFQALKYLAHLRAARANLVGRWQRQMVNLGGPNANEIGSQPEIIFHQFVEPLHQCLRWYKNIWMPLENELKKNGFKWERFISEIPLNHIQFGEIIRLRTAVVDMLPPIIAAETNRRIYLRNQEKLASVLHNLETNKNALNSTTMAEVVYQLKNSVDSLDSRAYEALYTRLYDLHAKSEILRRRNILIAKLEIGALTWAHAIKDRIGVHGHKNLPGDPESAWKWRQLCDELNRRAKVSLEELQERIVKLYSELFRITSELDFVHFQLTNRRPKTTAQE